METTSAEISGKIRSAIKAKLEELGAYVDEELPDYIMVMIANKKSKEQMNEDLGLFLGKNSTIFTDWLHEILARLKSLGRNMTDKTDKEKEKSSKSKVSKDRKERKKSSAQTSKSPKKGILKSEKSKAKEKKESAEKVPVKKEEEPKLSPKIEVKEEEGQDLPEEGLDQSLQQDEPGSS